MLQHIINILDTASVYFLVSLGLLIILSVMNVINLAHGAFLTVGAYAAVVVSNNGWNPWWAILAAPVVGWFLGLVTEKIIIRRLYHRPLDAILATWGLSIVIIQVISYFFGRGTHFVEQIMDDDPFELFNAYLGQYRIFLMLVAVGLGIILALITRHTNSGNVARAVIMNPELAKTLGINTTRVNSLTFAFGSALAAFAGVVIVPLMSADPNMGTSWLIITFMVALAAGASLAGLAVGALVLACTQVLASYYWSAVIGSILILLVPMIILRVAPGGIDELLHRIKIR